MTNSDIKERFQTLRNSATILGHEYIQNKLPLELGKELTKTLKPFVKLEKALDKVIKSIK